MLLISFECSADVTEIEWHVGERLPEPEGPVFMLQADGDELEFILNGFRNIPTVFAANVVTWTGDMADFIFVNLRNVKGH